MAQINVFEKTAKSLLGPTIVQLWLSSYGSDSEGRVFLSPELLTDTEVDESVNYLINQLEEVRKKAKNVLKKNKKA